MFKQYVIIFTVFAAISISCGKKTEDSSGSNNPGTGDRDGQDTRQEVVIRGQKLVCEDRWDCPDNIAKIVITGQKSIKTCTGILIKEDEILTSSSCLPKYLRTKNINCSNNIFFVFPETADKPSKTFLCDKLVYADINIFEGYPELWKNDMAVLKVKGVPNRSVTKIHRNGVDTKIFNLWKVDIETDKIGTLKKTECEVLKENYLSPFSGNAFSGMLVSSGCDLSESSVGAALLNSENKILGVYAKEMSEKIYSFLEVSNLLSEDMGQYYHFSNSSCMLYDPQSNDQVRTAKECSKLNTFDMLNRYRSRLLKSKDVHKEGMDLLEKKLEVPVKYFKWDLKYFAGRDGRSFEAHYTIPRCLFGIDDWIDEFSRVRRRRRTIQTKATIEFYTPNYIFQSKLNNKLRVVSVLDETQTKKYSVTFNPYTAYVKKFRYTDVFIESNLYNKPYTGNYQKVDYRCD